MGLFKLKKPDLVKPERSVVIVIGSDGNLTGERGISSRGNEGSHCRASWELGGILPKGREAMEAGWDETLPLPESGLKPPAEMFSGYLLGHLAS